MWNILSGLQGNPEWASFVEEHQLNRTKDKEKDIDELEQLLIQSERTQEEETLLGLKNRKVKTHGGYYHNATTSTKRGTSNCTTRAVQKQTVHKE